MPDEFVGKGMRQRLVGGRAFWEVSYTKPDGTDHHHTFPVEAFANYAGELGLDISNDDEFQRVVDYVLHEPYAPSYDEMPRASLLKVHTLLDRVDQATQVAKSSVSLKMDSIDDMHSRFRAGIESPDKEAAE